MARQAVNRGAQADDNTGDPLRTAFGKINDTTLELYNALGDGTTLTINDIVTSSEGVATNNNDTSLPTTAAVKAYVDSNEANTTYTLSAADGDQSDEEKIIITGTDSGTSSVTLEAGTGLSIARSGTKITLTNTVTDTDQNTTYSISCADGDNADEEKIVLTDSGSGTDEIVLEAGTGLSIARSGDKITLTNTVADTDTNTTYTISAVDSGDDAIIRLTDSASTPVTDDVKLVAGSNITITPSGDDITIASTASGGGFTVATKTFSGDGTTATFTLDNTISDVDNVQVYIDGVYQRKANYSHSGQDIIFSSGNIPPTGTDNLEVVHYVMSSGSSSVETDTFNGDDYTDASGFTLTSEPNSVNNIQVYIDGVYQNKSNFSVSGTTLTFTTDPPAGTNNVEVINIIL